jgi:hypothetical protein
MDTLTKTAAQVAVRMISWENPTGSGTWAKRVPQWIEGFTFRRM